MSEQLNLFDPSTTVPFQTNNTQFNFSTEAQFRHNLVKLAEPFEVDDVYWLPQSISGDKATAAAYANKRAYTDRLDEVLGAENWQIEIDAPVTTEYTKEIKAKYIDWKDPSKGVLEPAKTLSGTKVMVKARCGVYVAYRKEWVWKSSTGVADSSDENSITTAEAQAVKRAISMWGPGNYFYQLGTQTVPYDKFKKKFSVDPQLPDWAKPKPKCEDCKQEVNAFHWSNKGVEQVIQASDVLKRGRATYGVNLCADCQKVRKDKK